MYLEVTENVLENSRKYFKPNRQDPFPEKREGEDQTKQENQDKSKNIINQNLHIKNDILYNIICHQMFSKYQQKKKYEFCHLAM